MGAIFGLLAPLVAKLFAWVLDWINTKDSVKKDFYKFVAAFEADRGISIKLHQDAEEQLVRIRAELAEKKKLEAEK